MARRAARYGDSVRLRHGGGAIRKGPDGCGPGHGASGQRVLGELRQDGQSEWQRLAGVACVLAEDRHPDGLFAEWSGGQAGSLEGSPGHGGEAGDAEEGGGGESELRSDGQGGALSDMNRHTTIAEAVLALALVGWAQTQAPDAQSIASA